MKGEQTGGWMGAWGEGTVQLVAQDRNTEKMIHGLILLEPIFFHFVETGLGGLCLRRSCQTLMALMLRRLPRVDVPMDMSPSCTSHTQGQLPLLKLGPAHREEQCYRH